MAPRPLPQSWPSPSSPHHSTQQWQWHPAMAPRPLPKVGRHTTMAPRNGTTSTAPCNGTLVPRPIRQSGSSPSPLLEVRTPIAIAIWGIRKESRNIMCIFAILWSYFLLPRQRPSELLWRYNDYLPAIESKTRPKSLNLWLVELAWIFCRTQEAKSSVSQNIKKRTRSRGVLRWVVWVCASLVCVSCKW